MRQILIATFNKAKQEEFKKILRDIVDTGRDHSLQLVFPQNLKIKNQVQETGKTFAENSLIKARYFFNKLHIPALADDGGLEIPILNNEPGVKSRRWGGFALSDEELIAFTLQKLKKFKTENSRRAYLKTCITYYDGKNIFQETEKIEGYIAHKPSQKRIAGYPFRSLFIITQLEKYYGDWNFEEYQKFSHRRKALIRLLNKISIVGNGLKPFPTK